LCASLALILLPGSVLAEDSSKAWHKGFTVTPNGWLSGIKGTAGTVSDDLDQGGDLNLPDRVDVELEGDLEVLGFMFNAHWRGERWDLMFDSVWASVSQDASIGFLPILPMSEIRANIDANIYLLAAGYRVDNWERSSLTIFGGLRHYDLEVTIDAQSGLLPQPVSAKASDKWQDGVVGARWARALNENWGVSVLADVGFGESNSSNEIAASVGYNFSTWSVVGGVRYLTLDYENADYRADLELFGPMIGVSFRF
jgi:hypothetical protein